eukprot:2738174-Rhodomonas_salina.2
MLCQYRAMHSERVGRYHPALSQYWTWCSTRVGDSEDRAEFERSLSGVGEDCAEFERSSRRWSGV